MALEDQLKEIRRGTIDILTEEELVRKLKENRLLNVKFGVDPTAPDIHLGHTVPLQKLKQFQDLGHNIQLVIGDYTAMIGDPSGRSETRPSLTREKISENMKTYETQVFKILDPEKTELLYNSTWLEQFSGTDMIKLGSKYTVQQLLQRRDFNDRIQKNKPLSVTELLYPLLVGYDSVHLKSDIEIGGTDQLFNFMASREIQKAYGQEPEVVITLPMLEGLDGIRKMSKSLGNAIGVTEHPDNMYGKIMSIPDNLMWRYYELLSDRSIEEIEEMNSSGKNPMQYKLTLASEIVSRYHGESAAADSEKCFNQVHRRRNMPENLEQMSINYQSESCIIPLLRKSGRANTNGEARRLIRGGGVRIDGERIDDPYYQIEPKDGQVLQIGKTFYRKLRFAKDKNL